jgi:16S rRNA (cytidine1402-2'-O)-methyltransferase
LTTLHECGPRAPLDRLAGELEGGETLKGEFVVVVAPPAENETEISDERILEQLNRALKVESFRDAVRSVAEVLRVKRARVYELGLSLDRKRD